MSSKKKELEIVYNLEWKNKPTNGDEKSNIIGILDIPATTLDWKTFKSYLLKNSGATDDNVKVSYIDSEDREKSINSQLDFEIALYTFRHKARMNEFITLKLDCVNGKHKGVKAMAMQLPLVPKKINPLPAKKPEKPPEWFLLYMKKFREELLEEISTICSSKTHQINVHHARKLKADRQRTRKTPLLFGDVMNDKELSKSAKMERKLESKLEKLEHKTLKIKAKKMALRVSSDSDVGRSSGYLPPNSSGQSMKASVLKLELAPHMIGGETYCQTWEISNSGTLPWTSETQLRYAWGSQALKPLNKEVPCPLLQPGEKGKISVVLEVPKTPGSYECYWHFYHDGRRFGHWLGCDVIVDGPPVKDVTYLPSPTYDVINIQDVYELVLPTSWTKAKEEEETADFENPFSDEQPSKFATFCFPNSREETGNEEETKDDLIAEKESETKIETNPFSDSDNQSIVSISDSSVHSATSDDFVLLKMSANSPKDEIEKEELTLDSAAPNSSENIANIDALFTKLSMVEDEAACEETIKEDNIKKEPIVVVQQIPIDLSNKSNANGAENGENDGGYAYVHYKGRKIPISKKHLSPEFLVTAESVPESELKNLDKFKVEKADADEEPVRDTTPTFRTSTPSVDVQSESHEVKVGETRTPPSTHSFCSLSVNNTSEYANATYAPGSSMTSSMNENRFFVFPQYYPGYEVVPPLTTGYVDPNIGGAMPFQPVYGYNTVGEVLVNDWTTGLNYAACVRYPNAPNQYHSSPGNSTANTSRRCSSIPNSNAGSPVNQLPPSPREQCPCKASNINVCAGADQHRFEQSSTNSTYEEEAYDTSAASNQPQQQQQQRPPSADSRGGNRIGVPDLLSGATVVATSAINTARSVLNMFVPPRSADCGYWINGHWISTNPKSKREKNLRLLFEMGFVDRNLNATLLGRYNDDINAVIWELLQ